MGGLIPRRSPVECVYLFSSDRFSPTPGELVEDHDDFINPGCFARELADFLQEGLARHDYRVGFRCAEDWGQWLELEHAGGYTLAVGCANLSELENGVADHRVFVSPDKPHIRKLFRKIDVSADIERLGTALKAILSAEERISGLQIRSSM